jgi:ribosomal subunit interface protein
MSVRITGRHCEITDRIRSYVEKKLARLERYMERVQSVDVIIDHHHGYEYKTELLVKDGPVSITAKTEDTELERAIDALIDKAERQLKKKWEKVRGATKKQKAKGNSKRLVTVAASSEGETEEEEEEEAEESTEAETNGTAVATRKKAAAVQRRAPFELEKYGILVFPPEEQDVPTLSLEEAAEDLFFKDAPFLCFREEESGELCVMYRRRDGNIGAVKPIAD